MAAITAAGLVSTSSTENRTTLIPFPASHRVRPLIVRHGLRMHRTIDLDTELRRCAVEIEDVGTDCMLAAEVQSLLVRRSSDHRVCSSPVCDRRNSSRVSE